MGSSIKLEPTFLAENEEALLVLGMLSKAKLKW